MAKPKAPAAPDPSHGLSIDRVFSTEGQHPFDSVAWETRDAAIRNHTGEAIFEQLGVEFPTAFSPLAVNVVASKYFYGDLAPGNGSPADGKREYSLKQLVHRVTRTIADWGRDQHYFATEADAETFYDELTWLCTNQVGAFNSPVWFNVGLHAQYGVTDSGGKTIAGWDAEAGRVVAVDPYERPQASACFIISVDDSVDDIWKLMGESARLFKFGSGVGADWSKLRSSMEKLSGGGTPSGPVSFMKVQDATGGTIKSGGKCLAPHTKVYTERGPVTVEELAGRTGEWPFYALSYDPPAGRMKVKRARAWCSGAKEVVRVHTDKGHFDLSFDHPVKLAHGPFEMAGDLQPGQRLFQSTLDPHSAGYVRVGLRDGKKGREQLHRLVASDVMGHDLDALSLRHESVHHRDGDKLNNHPDNLEVLSQADHAGLHGAALAAAGEHVFQHAAGDPRFDSAGENNGMHADGAFWKDKPRARAYRQLKRTEMLDRDPKRLQRAAVQQRYMNLGWTLLNAGHDISTVDRFFAAYQAEIGRVDSKPRRRAAFEAQFGGYDGFLAELDAANHRVTRIEWLGEMPVYSVEVDCPTADDKSAATGHNYLIWSGSNDTPFGSGVVVSNTRRAAIMQTLKVWHPDILEFVRAKQTEERKAWALIEEGYDGSFNGDAYGSVAFQNVNQSVRLDDAFMAAADAGQTYGLRAVTTGETVETVDARDLLLTVSEGTHVCGDPGAQYEDTIQRWHTCKNTGPINSSNPCVTGDTLVATDAGLRRIDAMLGETPRVVGLDGRLHATTRVIETGTKPVYRLRTKSGYEVKLTADHQVWTETRGDVPAADLRKGDAVRLLGSPFGTETLDADAAEYVGLMLGDGCVSGSVVTLTMNKDTEWAVAEKAALVVNRFDRERQCADVSVTERTTSATVATGAASVRTFLAEWAVLDAGSASKRLADRALRLDRPSTAALLRGLFTADGTVVDSGDKSQYVGLDSTSEALLQQVQTLLLSFGIKSKLYRDRRLTDRALLPDGKGGLKDYAVQQMHSLRVTRTGRVAFEEAIGFLPESRKAEALRALNARVGAYADRMSDPVATLELLGEEPVYDLTEPVTSHFVAGGVAVHNCSEYMFLDDSACNLASLNLMTFKRADGSFDVARYRAASRLFLTAQEILVDNAGYPSADIAANSHRFRPLGLGFANLGALLMSMGLPYDSDEGRAVAGALMAIEHCEGYARSAEIAANPKIGPFEGFAENREPMLAVMRMHRDAVATIHASCPAALKEAAQESADRMVALGEAHGYRNAQATVLAPTGTIGFMMDCDTTGIEPDLALVKYKLLAGKGDGLMKIVNQTVPEALQRLGYADAEAAEILAFIDAHDTIEGAPGLRPEHLPVFDCAFKPANGERSISHMGHIRMMAATQPFISGAISKTVNLPESATPADIYDAYMQSWKLGLKAVAIYRENSKRSQPLSTKKGGNTAGKTATAAMSGDGAAVLEPEVRIIEKTIEKVVYRPHRERLPDERPSVTHKFSVAGHEGYLHVGLYPPGSPSAGRPGEIFITMAKQGSTIAGLMDSFATAISLAFQYGVPLEDLVSKFGHVRFEPAGFTNNPRIPMAKSITDYIFRYLSIKFLGGGDGAPSDLAAEDAPADPAVSVAHEAALHGPAADETQADLFAAGLTTTPPSHVGGTIEAALAPTRVETLGAFQNQEDAPACPNCGGITVRAGACYSCPNCGSSTGCG